jgi:hypothetical protein
VASTWIIKRGERYRVLYRTGGRLNRAKKGAMR